VTSDQANSSVPFHKQRVESECNVVRGILHFKVLESVSEFNSGLVDYKLGPEEVGLKLELEREVN
jgi:hypothetical protein